MARPAGVSQEITDKAVKAHELMNRKTNPLSVRKACDKAQLSIASYYKVYPPSSRQAEPEGTQVAASVKKEGSPTKQKRKPRVTSGNTGNEVRDLKNYISKLEHKLVKLALKEDEE